MLSFFHWGLLVGLGIILIAVMKADQGVRTILVIGVIVAMIFVKLNSKKR